MDLSRLKAPPPRIQIQRVEPLVDGGRYALKRTVGEPVEVSADVFRDGHDVLGAALRYKPRSAGRWREVPMEPLGNDRWRGTFPVDAPGYWCYRIEAWTD